jgi:hypothetical protein
MSVYLEMLFSLQGKVAIVTDDTGVLGSQMGMCSDASKFLTGL